MIGLVSKKVKECCRAVYKYKKSRGDLMSIVYYEWKNDKKDIDVKQYVYYIKHYHYNWHESLEFIIVLQGEVEMSVNGNIYILQEDDIMLVNSNVGHATLAKKINSIAMVIHLNPIYFRSYYKDYHLLQFSCRSNFKTRNNESFSRLRNIALEMVKYIKGEHPEEKIYFESLLNQLIANLIRDFPPKMMSSKELVRNKKRKEDVDNIVAYIEKNYKNKISLEELSSFSGYHESYISQIVKQQLGINYYEYLTRIRLREATYDLTDLKRKISDIALSHGFSDVKAFNIAFKKNFGKTPSEYRKQLLKEKMHETELREKRYLEEHEFNTLLMGREEMKNKVVADQISNKKIPKGLSEEDFLDMKEIIDSLDDSVVKLINLYDKWRREAND
jgi:AraC-like DNA-binding protein/mannose-6-phosphate isomerase-like protein (cupin superfamily)